MTHFSNDSTDPWLMTNVNEDNSNNVDSNDMKFNDNFEPGFNAKQTNSSNSSLTELPDSQQYIKSLGISNLLLSIISLTNTITKCQIH